MNFVVAKKRIKYREGGFTIIELVTVMVIIAIITVFGIANYHAGNRQVTLDIQARQLAQDLRKMQGWALSAHQMNGVALAGYGIYVAQGGTSYIIYTDNNNNGRYTAGVDSIVQTVTLNTNLEVSQCSPVAVSVNYIPPDPITKISDNGGAQSDTAMVEFRIKGTSIVRKIYVNRAGLIYVD